MATWNEFVAVLDEVIGFGNKVSSSVKMLDQWFDNQTDEKVLLLEYRIKVEKSPLLTTASCTRSSNAQGGQAHKDGWVASTILTGQDNCRSPVARKSCGFGAAGR